ncbi:hypothetical protein ACLOJK_020241 [Asimina triloba]
MLAWKCYQKCLALHPVKTQVISSGVLWGIGDIAAQAITHSTLKNQPHTTSHHTLRSRIVCGCGHGYLIDAVRWTGFYVDRPSGHLLRNIIIGGS